MENRNLLYLTVGGSKEYLRLLNLFLMSLEKTSNLSNIDVKVFATRNYVKNYVNPTKINVSFIEFPIWQSNKESQTIKILEDKVVLNYNEMAYSIQKLKVSNLDDFLKYDKILYMDVDCLICDDVSTLFEKIDDKSCLHVCKDTDDFSKHNCLYYNPSEYKPEIMERMRSKNIFPFSGGIFGFKPSEVMAYHFKTVYGLICKCQTDFFYEQSHMNQYFNKNCISKDVFSELVMTPQNEFLFKNKNPAVVHYAAAHVPPATKRQMLESLLNGQHGI